MAGMDTTGHLCGMAIYYLTQYKDIKLRILEEVKNSNGDYQKIPYFEAFIKEVMRFYGPGNRIFVREAQQDNYLNDLFVKKGTLLSIIQLSVHRNPQFYNNPHCFDPERWLEDGAVKNIPFTFLPFSAGNKNCIGQHLAWMEIKIILQSFLQMFDFELYEGYQLVLTDKFLIGPQEPLKVQLKARK